MNVIQSVFVGVVGAASLMAQGAPARAEFEVASIKPAAAIDAMSGAQVHIGIQVDGAQVHCNSFSLKDYLRMAYKVKDHQIVGPDWLASERFDIHATLPAGGTREQVPEMLQTLLEQRFQIKMHRGSKEFPVYGLIAAKGGIKLKESPLDPEEESPGGKKAPVSVQATGGRGGTNVQFGRGAYFSLADNKFEAKKLTMAQMADTLSRFVDKPVVDMTELTGTYDLTLDFTPEDYRAVMIRAALYAGVSLPQEALRLLEGASDESLFKGLQTLGLKLEARRAPLDVLIIDSVNKVPTEN